MQEFIQELTEQNLTLELSPKGLADLLLNVDKSDPDRNLVWTTDATVELPIIRNRSGKGSELPITLMELWRKTLEKWGNLPALSQKIDGKWSTITFQEYYEENLRFACALAKMGVTERSAVSILSYNNPQWFFAFNGAIFANTISCGIYITNTPEACQYVLEHNDSEVCVVENQEQLDKILVVWDQLPKLRYYLLINPKNLEK